MTAEAEDGHAAGEAPQRRRTRHSGVDVMDALDDPDVMLRSDPNLNAKVTWQVRHWPWPASTLQLSHYSMTLFLWARLEKH